MHTRNAFLCLLFALFIECCKSSHLVRIHVDLNNVVANLSHFWESTGFCPPTPHENSSQWLQSEDMMQNLKHISSVPFSGIKQVRIHWLLDTVQVVGETEKALTYDFSRLDTFVEQLYELQLHPGFELMGNPSNYFSDFTNETQVYLWRDLVQQIGKRFVALYGLRVVRRWNFEIWNEPAGHRFDGLNFTTQGFLNYVDACAEGLRLVSPELKIGLPGGSCRDKYNPKNLCWATLNHVQNGKNFFSGKRGMKVAFLSFHRKGNEPNNTEVIMAKEMRTYEYLKKHLQSLVQIPFYNDEGDPLVRWSRDRWWRADVTYAAMVVKGIVMHQNKWLSQGKGIPTYALLSNDNGFLSYNPHFFTQRTLTARFQMNNTSPHHVQLMRKPVLTAMGLLAHLGDVQVDARVTTHGVQGLTTDSVGALATVHNPSPYGEQDSWQAAVVVYHSEDTFNVTAQGTLNVTFSSASLPQDAMCVIYQLNNRETNPYTEWVQSGKPKTPTVQDFARMRNQENPVRIAGPLPFRGEELQMSLFLPGVNLIHICAKAKRPPDQVTGVDFQNITAGQVLISWDDSCVNARCIKTYEVYHSASQKGPFRRVNADDTIFNLFVFVGRVKGENESVVGFYKIRAVDYWGRPGTFSLITPYPGQSPPT